MLVEPLSLGALSLREESQCLQWGPQSYEMVPAPSLGDILIRWEKASDQGWRASDLVGKTEPLPTLEEALV